MWFMFNKTVSSDYKWWGSYEENWYINARDPRCVFVWQSLRTYDVQSYSVAGFRSLIWSHRCTGNTEPNEV